MVHYSIYGLRVQSNLALNDVTPQPVDAPAAVDVELTLAGTSAIPEEWEALPWRLVRDLQGDDWCLRGWTACSAGGVAIRLRAAYEGDETTTLFSPDGSRLRVHWRQPSRDAATHLADISAWVLDSALAFSARLRGWPVLHGSVVIIDGHAVAFLGQKGDGKSTLAATFIAGGCALLADDHVVLKPEGDALQAQPGPPNLRLWPTSLPVLGTRSGDLPRVYSQLEKRRVDVGGCAGDRVSMYHNVPMPLSGAFLLAPRDPSRAGAVIEPLPPSAALHQLLLYRWSQIHISSDHAAIELDALARIARTVPVRRILRPDGIESLPHVARAIRADLAAHAV